MLCKCVVLPLILHTHADKHTHTHTHTHTQRLQITRTQTTNVVCISKSKFINMKYWDQFTSHTLQPRSDIIRNKDLFRFMTSMFSYVFVQTHTLFVCTYTHALHKKQNRKKNHIHLSLVLFHLKSEKRKNKGHLSNAD